MGFKFDDKDEEIDFSIGGDEPNVSPSRRGNGDRQARPVMPSRPTPQQPVKRTQRQQPATRGGEPKPSTNNKPVQQANLPGRANPAPVSDGRRSRPTQTPPPQKSERTVGIHVGDNAPTVSKLPRKPAPEPIREEPEVYEEEEVFQQPQPYQVRDPRPTHQTTPENYYEEETGDEEDDLDAEEEESRSYKSRFVPKRNPAGKGTSNKKGNRKPKKPVNQSKGGRWAGGRKIVLIARIGLAIVLLVVVAVGGKQILFPTSFPSPSQVISVVKGGLGVTDFPIDKGEGFAVAFTEAYFTYPESGTDYDREEVLRQFMSDEVMGQMGMSIGVDPVDSDKSVVQDEDGNEVELQSSVGVVSTPIVTGSKSIDDNNAVISVQATLTTGSVFNISVPVYYDPESNGMAVSAPITLLPTVQVADVPVDNHQITWASDSELSDEVQPTLESFFAAWAASDQDIIKQYSLESSTLNVTQGLNGTVLFDRLDELNVEAVDGKDATTEDKRNREAVASVMWADPNSPNITYKQTYLLTLKQTPDGKWNVVDISTLIKEEK